MGSATSALSGEQTAALTKSLTAKYDALVKAGKSDLELQEQLTKEFHRLVVGKKGSTRSSGEGFGGVGFSSKAGKEGDEWEETKEKRSSRVGFSSKGGGFSAKVEEGVGRRSSRMESPRAGLSAKGGGFEGSKGVSGKGGFGGGFEGSSKGRGAGGGAARRRSFDVRGSQKGVTLLALDMARKAAEKEPS
ncbi:hypothetical protein B484DRAFT_407902, partial [Ochromonadaceae sp. CCMP2298]